MATFNRFKNAKEHVLMA